MFVLTWYHTRTGELISRRFDTPGQAMIQVLQVRTHFPDHPMWLNGEAVP